MTKSEDTVIDTPTLARHLVRSQPTAALSSVSRVGQPHGSLVICCCDMAAQPVLLLSRLAVHTENILAEPRVALLFEDCGDLENPLTGPRLTLSGKLVQTKDTKLAARFLRRHPEAEMYADFDDFDFYQLDVTSAYLVAGFGRIETIERSEYLFDAPCNDELGQQEQDILEHMNNDHADALDLFAQQLAGLTSKGWLQTGIDAEGIDMRLGGQTARIDFDLPLATAHEARKKLVALVELARKKA